MKFKFVFYFGFITVIYTNPLLQSDTSNDSFLDSFLPGLKTNANYFLDGERLLVTCEVLQTDDTSKDISFSRDVLHVDNHVRYCFNSSHIDRLDERTAVLNITVTPTKTAQLFECYKSPGCKDADLIGQAGDVYVEYAPQRVANFSCVTLNWDEAMKCTWDDPVTYMIEENIVTTLQYATLSSKKFHPCEALERHSCFWDKHTHAYFQNQYVMKVTVTNRKKNVSVESDFEVHTNKIVKPDPVNDLRTTDLPLKFGCVHLKWSHSAQYEWLSYQIYRIKVKRLNHRGKQDLNNFEVLTNNLTKMEYDACGFLAHFHLNFSVEVHPTLLYDGYWSTPAYVVGWTPQEAPDTGPPIALGSYFINKLTLTLFWNALDKSKANGIIDSYILETSDGLKKNVSSNDFSTTLKLIEHRPLTVSIFAHNGAGKSERPSVWKINPMHIEVPRHVQESFVARSINSNLNLSWSRGKENNTYHFTVYWCYSPTNIGTCEESLNWMHVATSESHYNIPHLPHPANDYSFGLSIANDKLDTSGIFWTQCLLRSTEPNPPNFNTDPLYSAIRVSWEPQTCSYQSGYKVEKYFVKWCIQSECGGDSANNIKATPLSSRENKFEIKDLNPGTKYKTTVELLSDDGKSAEAIWKEAVPLKQRDDNENSAILMIVLATLLPCIALPIIIIFIIFCRKLQKRKQMIEQKLQKAIHKFPPSNSDKASPSSSSSSTFPDYVTDNSNTQMTSASVGSGSFEETTVKKGNVSRTLLVPITPCPLPKPSTVLDDVVTCVSESDSQCNSGKSTDSSNVSADNPYSRMVYSSTNPRYGHGETGGISNNGFDSSNYERYFSPVQSQVSRIGETTFSPSLNHERTKATATVKTHSDPPFECKNPLGSDYDYDSPLLQPGQTSETESYHEVTHAGIVGESANNKSLQTQCRDTQQTFAVLPLSYVKCNHFESENLQTNFMPSNNDYVQEAINENVLNNSKYGTDDNKSINDFAQIDIATFQINHVPNVNSSENNGTGGDRDVPTLDVTPGFTDIVELPSPRPFESDTYQFSNEYNELSEILPGTIDFKSVIKYGCYSQAAHPQFLYNSSQNTTATLSDDIQSPIQTDILTSDHSDQNPQTLDYIDPSSVIHEMNANTPAITGSSDYMQLSCLTGSTDDDYQINC